MRICNPTNIFIASGDAYIQSSGIANPAEQKNRIARYSPSTINHQASPLARPKDACKARTPLPLGFLETYGTSATLRDVERPLATAGMQGCRVPADFTDYPALLAWLVQEPSSLKRIFTDYPTLLAKRTSNHPPNLPPISGRRLNLKCSETKHFRLFWYRGTRDGLFISWRREGTRLEFYGGHVP